MLVDNEIIGSFINRSFLDPEDDRVLDEMLNHDIGGGLRLRDLVNKGLVDRQVAFEVAPNVEALKMALKGIEVSQPGIL